MVIVSPRKRLESIERSVLPSMFVGVLSKSDTWMKKTLEETLPELEAQALKLAQKCKESGECREDEPLCNEDRIRGLFHETRIKLEKEHLIRESRTRFHH